MTTRPWAIGVIVGILALVALVLAAAAYILHAGGLGNEVGLPMLTIGSVILLLATLAMVSVAFALFDLDDRSQALALPEGSIRAVIAMMLIVLFAILTIYLFSSLSSSKVASLSLKDPKEVQKVVDRMGPQVVTTSGPDGNGDYSVLYYTGHSTAGDDFAKQVLVMLGTLVAAISSFYFGTRAAAGSGAVDDAPEKPVLSVVSPTTAEAKDGSVTFELKGTSLAATDQIELLCETTRLLGVNAKASSATVTFEVPVTTRTPYGPWDVLASGGGRSARLTRAITVGRYPG